MPRSTAKPQVDKSGQRSSVQMISPQTQDLEVEDVIPGCLTQDQWIDMLNQEDAEEAVGEIMAELLDQVMEGCFKVYIKRQLEPFTTYWAKSYLIQVLEQQFLCRDEGDETEEASKTEDSEPMPAIPDVWAQGCFPVVHPSGSSKTASQREIDTGQAPGQTDTTTSQPCNALAQTNSSTKQHEKEKSPSKPVGDRRYKVLSSRSPPQIRRKKKQPDHLPPKLVQSKFLPSLSSSSDKKGLETESKSREQSVFNQTPARSLHQQKDYRSIPKLDPSCLPRHCIIPQYEILDNNNRKPDTKKPRGPSKLEPKYNKQTKWTVTSSKPLTSYEDQQAKRRNEPDVLLRKSFPPVHTREVTMSSGLLRMDTMDLAEGVSLLDPRETNPLMFKPQAPSTKLRPIRSGAILPLFSVDQFTAGPPPRVTSLFQS